MGKIDEEMLPLIGHGVFTGNGIQINTNGSSILTMNGEKSNLTPEQTSQEIDRVMKE